LASTLIHVDLACVFWTMNRTIILQDVEALGVNGGMEKS
jgi:hypothetical protein